ncbi:MAG: cytochrome b N-terminal domain-containing protein [Nannocystaceae bacterium]
MINRAIDWLDERTGIRAAWRWTADEEVPGGARLRYVFGSILMFLFMQQIVLGVLLATYYSPSATDAWASTAYLTDRVSGGWFLRGLHHHGSSAMVVVTILHMAQVLLAGAYRRPRELNWITGLAMGMLVLAFALTGYLLPWDQKGYWATQVATGIMGTVPGGEPLRTILQGGSEYGNLTITRFYALHVFVLPGTLGVLLFVHLALFRRHGVTPPAELSELELKKKSQAFYPHQLFLDVLAMAVMGAILVLLTFWTHGAELFAPAQPASNFVARPEWYFLFLFQLLKYFEGPLQIIATVIIPGAATTFLLALPWLDRANDRRIKSRMPVLSGVALMIAAVVALTAVAMDEDASNKKYQKGLAAAHKEAHRARDLAHRGVLPRGGDAVYQNDPQVKARTLFVDHCETCHAIDGEGGDEAPDFAQYGSREWLRQMIRNPSDPSKFGGTKHEDMEAYPEAELPEAQLAAVVEYLTSLMGEQGGPTDATLVATGKLLFADELDCNSCHEVEPGESGDGPNLSAHGTTAWIARVIRDASQDDLFGEAADMPKFAKKLSKNEIQMLSRFIHSLRRGGEIEQEGGASPQPATDGSE